MGTTDSDSPLLRVDGDDAGNATVGAIRLQNTSGVVDSPTGFANVNNNISVEKLIIENSTIESDTRAVRVEGGSTIDRVVMKECDVSETGLITGGSGDIGVVEIENVVGGDETDIDDADRWLKNGIGDNGSDDPATAGVWNGEGREGIKIFWDDGGTDMLAEYVSGNWYSRAL